MSWGAPGSPPPPHGSHSGSWLQGANQWQGGAPASCEGLKVWGKKAQNLTRVSVPGEAICSLGSGPAEFSQHLVSGSVTDAYSLLCRARSEVESN